MKELDAQNPSATIYEHWMQNINGQTKERLESTKEAMAKYYDRNACEQPDIKIGDQVVLNGNNMRSKRPSKNLSPKLYGPFKVLEKRGARAYKLLIPAR